MSKTEFGKYIYELRTSRNLTLRQLAKKVNISPYYISYMERGTKRNPSVEIMARMFKALKMSKQEIEHLLDLHAKANDCVSYDLVDFIMDNPEVRETIRAQRDKKDSVPNWDDFMNKINNG